MSLSIRLGGLAPLAVATLPDLKGLQLPQGIVHLLGLVTESDGLGGLFYWNETSTAVADDSTVVTPTDSAGAGRWLRVRTYDGPNSITYTVPVVPDGVTDNSTVLQDAIDRLYAAGGGILQLPPGDIYIGSGLIPRDRVTIRGCGMGVTKLVQGGDFYVFDTGGAGTGISYQYVAFEDFTVVGRWQSVQAQLTNSRHFVILRTQHVRFERVESMYCNFMGITTQYCGEVTIKGCRVRFAARDAINTTSCERNIIIGNRMQHCWDDAIAVHQTLSDGNPPREQQVIEGNIIEDCFGIKALGLRKASITGNIITRPKGYGIYFGASGNEGYSDQLAITITGNVITDVVQSSKFSGGAQQHGILFSNGTQGYQAPVVGAGTPDINKPEDFWYLNNASGGGAQNVGASSVLINNNVIAWTLKHTAVYSDWGMDNVDPANGRAFQDTGWADPVMTTGHLMTGTGITLDGAILDMQISNNKIEGCNSCITVASSLTALNSLFVIGNLFSRYDGHGIGLETGSLKRGRVRVRNNVFDGDPYFENSKRTAGPDGTWSAAGTPTPTCVDNVNFSGVEFFYNSIRNINSVMHNSPSTVNAGGNVFYMQPHSSTTLAVSNNGNKGIRVPWWFEDLQMRLIWEDSDPTSATYGNLLGAQQTLSASTMPTSAYYITGQIVWYIGVAVATQTLEAGLVDPTPQYTLIGWRRLTTGNAHVLNTDWRELRCLTGN